MLLHIYIYIYKVKGNAKLFVVKEKKDKMNGCVRCWDIGEEVAVQKTEMMDMFTILIVVLDS